MANQALSLSLSLSSFIQHQQSTKCPIYYILSDVAVGCIWTFEIEPSKLREWLSLHLLLVGYPIETDQILGKPRCHKQILV